MNTDERERLEEERRQWEEDQAAGAVEKHENDVEEAFWAQLCAKIRVAASVEDMCRAAVTSALAGERVAILVPSMGDAEAALGMMREALDAAYAFGSSVGEVLDRITFTVAS